MTGISYKVTFDDREPRAKLEELIGRMENAEGFYKNVGEHLLVSVAERFETETAPDGQPWKTLSGVTIENRLKRFGNAPLTILRMRGRLAGSFNYEASSQHARVGTSVIYAAIQHFGGKAGRNKKVTIPSRPILGLSDDDEIAILEIAEDWLAVE